MSLTTCAVRARVYKQDGTPDVGALVTATLNRFDVGDGFVGPSEVEAVVGADGVAILNLWPNELGATESTYKIRISGSQRTLNLMATVPNVASMDLEDIATLPPYPGKQNGELAVEEAVEKAGIATTQAGIATTQAGIAVTQAGIATTQAGIAVGSATAAAASEAMALAARPTTSASPPANPLPNTEWIDEATGRHYTWLAEEGVWAEMYAAQVVDNPARVSQLEAALGADGGAGEVGFKQDAPGAVARKVQDELRERVSVKQFGAKGDGVTDDVAAIVAVPRTRRVRLPAGTFVVSNTDFGATDLDLEGEGEGKTILLWKAGSPESSLFKFSGAAKVRFASLTIDSNRENQSDSAGYYAAVQHFGSNGASLILDHVEFRNGRIDDVMVIGPTGAGESMRLEITNCHFVDGLVGTATRAAQAVAVSEGVNVTFKDNRLLQPTQPAQYGRGGLVMQRPAGSTSLAWSRLTATGNYFQNFGRGTLNALGCIYVYSGAETAIISGNTAKNVRGSAFCVKGDCGNTIISDNLVDGHASTNYAAISLFDMADSYTSYIGRNRRISGNVIRNSEYSGIYVDGNINGASAKVANVHVTDNIIDGGVRGIHLRAVDTSKVCGNTITNTTGVAILLDATTGICDVLDNTIQGGVVGLTTTGDVSAMALTARGNSIKGLVGGNAFKLAGSVASFDFRNNKIDGCTGAFEIVGCSGNGYIIDNTVLNTSSYVLSKAGTYGNLTYRDNVTSSVLGFTGMRMQPIVAGVVTIFADWHQIDTEGSAATDDLDTINGGYEGRMLTLNAANNARDVVLKDGAGNLKLNGDMVLDHSEDSITLMYRGSAWHEISRSSNNV